jgi:hypothetical protein
MLTPSSTCNVTAQFKPSTLGARSANLTINANGATQTFGLTGTGAVVNPHAVLVPAGDVAPNVFTLSGTSATPGGIVELHTTYTTAASMASIAMPVTTWTVDASGNVTATFMTDAGGTYEHWLVDVTSGLSTNHVVHIVSLSLP